MIKELVPPHTVMHIVLPLPTVLGSWLIIVRTVSLHTVLHPLALVLLLLTDLVAQRRGNYYSTVTMLHLSTTHYLPFSLVHSSILILEPPIPTGLQGGRLLYYRLYLVDLFYDWLHNLWGHFIIN
jgi:hypothetical protein